MGYYQAITDELKIIALPAMADNEAAEREATEAAAAEREAENRMKRERDPWEKQKATGEHLKAKTRALEALKAQKAARAALSKAARQAHDLDAKLTALERKTLTRDAALIDNNVLTLLDRAPEVNSISAEYQKALNAGNLTMAQFIADKAGELLKDPNAGTMADRAELLRIRDDIAGGIAARHDYLNAICYALDRLAVYNSGGMLADYARDMIKNESW